MYFLRRISLPGAALSLLLMLLAGGAAFIYRGYVDNRDIIDSRDLVLQSRAETRNLRLQLADQIEKFKALEAKLGSVQAALEMITPSQNTYSFGPNQSMILAEGRLTLGLIGSPANDSINININGKQHSAGAGDVIRFAHDTSTECRVQVQRFDMFRATLNASCTTAKSQ